jgi:prephenate dehydratase
MPREFAIMAAGRDENVVYLGPKASYTHQAALNAFGQHPGLQPVSTIEDVVAAVATGRASQGVVPFENSTFGSVVPTLDSLARSDGGYGGIQVAGEVYVPVRHCVVGIPNPSGEGRQAGDMAEDELRPEHDLSHIRKIYSHPQAFGQCKKFIDKRLKGTECQEVSSTSRGAALVAESRDATTAAIASPLTAKENNLAILAHSIQDDEDNTTRFLIISLESDYTSLEARTVINAETERTRYKTLVSFTVSHERPGALADGLAVFKKHGLNLTSINSRPSGEARFHYIFFAEFKGRRRQTDLGGEVNAALQELSGVALAMRWLGSWDSGED